MWPPTPVEQWADRVRLTQRYLAFPARYPAGIGGYDNWHEPRASYWAACAEHLDGNGQWPEGLDDEGAYDLFGDGDVNKLATDEPEPVNNAEPTPGSRTAYMREYMRKRRAKQEAGG